MFDKVQAVEVIPVVLDVLQPGYVFLPGLFWLRLLQTQTLRVRTVRRSMLQLEVMPGFPALLGLIAPV